MQVPVAYGGVDALIDVPDHATVLAPADPKPLADPERTVREAVRPWLRGLQPPATVVVAELPFPQPVVLPALLSELARVGLRAGSLSLLVRPGTVIDGDVADRYDVHVHDTADLDAHVDVGRIADAPVLFDRMYVEATTRITLGVVRPHHACGYTGGPETVCPGVASDVTVQRLRELADDPRADWLSLRGNPVHDFIRAAVKLAPVRVSLDLAVDAAGSLSGAWCGPLPHAHQAAADYVGKIASRRVTSEADVVVAAGAPLDAALAAAQRVVKHDGTIVVVADAVEPKQAGHARLVLARPEDVGSALQSLSPATIYVLPQAPRTVVMIGA